jgi:tetratricopeptide (TPR) repeat protein
MEDPKDPQEKDTTEQTLTDELTATSNDQNYSDSDRLRKQHLKTMLGVRPLKSTASVADYLLMFYVSERTVPLLESVSKELSQPPGKIPNEEVLCVIGPFNDVRLKEWAERGYIVPADRVMKPFDRWKEIGQEFPDWVFKSEISEHSDSGDFLEEDRESTVSVIAPESVPNVSVTLERDRRGIPVSASTARPSRVSANQSDRGVSFSFGKPLAILSVLAVAGAALWYLTPKKIHVSPPIVEVTPRAVLGQERFKGRVSESEWPASLQPLKIEDLYRSDSTGMRKIRRLLMDFEYGKIYLEQKDQDDLRRASDPAFASFEARKAATNLLAYYSLRRQDPTGARKLLESISEQDSTDTTTLINLGITYLFEKKSSEALEPLIYVSRIKDYSGLMKSLIGLAQAKLGRSNEFVQSFNEAVVSRPVPASIFGLWLKAIYEPESGRSVSGSQVSDLLNRNLWSDHDLHKDSVYPAPIFLPFIRGWMNEGLEIASKNVGLSLSKRKFMEWMRNRDSPESSFGIQADEVRELLLREGDVQSKVLLSYVLKESGNFDEAAQVLIKTLPNVPDKPGSSSWPWCLAGELQLQRGYYEEARGYFETALQKNRDDVGALNGIAIIARALGNYSFAERKFAEAQNLDPFFLPAKLRISRIHWQMISGRLK